MLTIKPALQGSNKREVHPHTHLQHNTATNQIACFTLGAATVEQKRVPQINRKQVSVVLVNTAYPICCGDGYVRGCGQGVGRSNSVVVASTNLEHAEKEEGAVRVFHE